MSQTDRQTDKSIHWNSAIFDVDENWAKLDTLPSFVKEVHRQKEVCPTTGKEHFQIHVICHRQVRLTQMCGWIKATKWKAVIGKEFIANSIKYCSKSATAVPGTQQILQGEKYLQLYEILFELAKKVELILSYHDSRLYDGVDFPSWESVSSALIEVDFKWVNKLNAPGVKNAWTWWGSVFYHKLTEFAVETGGGSIIEATSPEEVISDYLFLD